MNKTMLISSNDFLKSVHDQINSAIQSKMGRNWREDSISEGILGSLINAFSSVEISSSGNSNLIAWDAFKLSGTPEYDYGDIAVLVKISFNNGSEIEGVAFLEAKKISISNNQFDALDFNQLRRHLNHTHAHRTLLYDFNTTDAHLENLRLQYCCSDFTQKHLMNSLASTIPTKHLLSLNNKSRNILTHSLPFSYILISRYLNGVELDFNPTTIQMAKGFLGQKGRGGVNYLLLAHVSHNNNLTPDPNRIEINRSIYEKIDFPKNQNPVKFRMI